jgi:hypothetical protein
MPVAGDPDVFARTAPRASITTAVSVLLCGSMPTTLPA